MGSVNNPKSISTYGSITIKNAANRNVTVKLSGNDNITTINGSTSNASPAKNTGIDALWFTQDDNIFFNNDVESIVDTNLNNCFVGKINTLPNLNKFNGDDNLILIPNPMDKKK